METVKVKYKTQDERTDLIQQYNSMFLIEEQNITDGNYLIFASNVVENGEQEASQVIRDRINLISDYASVDNSILDSLENTIIDYEMNLIMGGM